MNTSFFDKTAVLQRLQHFLPAQEPLVNFVHHNTLHAVQQLEFDTALEYSAQLFGAQVYFSLSQFRDLYHSGKISHQILQWVVKQHCPATEDESWLDKLLTYHYDERPTARVGALRGQWRELCHLDLDWFIYPLLFRLLGNYLDQGIALWPFPIAGKSFLESVRELEQLSSVSIFKTRSARKLFIDNQLQLEDLLKLVVGDAPQLFEHYLWDQQFGHKGWSGMVSVVDHNPKTLLIAKEINLEELIYLELLMEIDTLNYVLGKDWQPLAELLDRQFPEFNAPVAKSELYQVLALWQKAYEWSYYDQVLYAISSKKSEPVTTTERKGFQGLFCMDDRECSFRRYVESLIPECETYGLPGFFNAAFYYQPSGSNFLSKQAPASAKPQHLIKEYGKAKLPPKNIYFAKSSHNFIIGWLVAQTVGFWFPIKLILNLLRPTTHLAYDDSVQNLRRTGHLGIESPGEKTESNLHLGYSLDEMTEIVYSVLQCVGLVDNFAPLIYLVGHGASSVNNPHFAAYECGACSGHDGGVNAQVVAYMANNRAVRANLVAKGITLPEDSIFIAALHDTTRDEITFSGIDNLSPAILARHNHYADAFRQALILNAKERSRRFVSINSSLSEDKIHEQIISRSLSIFEPRPELNHVTNALCLIGRRSMSRRVFLDRRAFLQSFDYASDPDGEVLAEILTAVVPVSGGISLEYYFSRVDQNQWGAGTKLPHNVVGLFGVANGTDGDLRTGLPSQMIEIHDPIRILFIIEHYPEVAAKSIARYEKVYQWFYNRWINLVVIHPQTRELYRYTGSGFEKYSPQTTGISTVNNLGSMLESSIDNLPVCLI